jgi:23S rRNA pseudouridine955/2504/2580 synthase
VERRIIGGAAAAGAPAVRHLTVDAESAGQRLDNLLLRLFKGVPKTHVYRVIRSGEVRVNGGRVSADTRVAAGDVLRLPPVRIAERAVDDQAAPPRCFPILFEDDHLLAIDKPAGVAVHGGSGVSFGVIEQLRRARPDARYLELVHRLDRETSGVLLLAKKRSALTQLQAQFRPGAGKEVRKTYLALVAGAWPASLKVIDVPLQRSTDAQGERHVRAVEPDAADAKRAITLVRIARALGEFTLLEATLRTGRTHQIRVHLAQAGHPIVGDDRYGDFALNRRLARGSAAEGAPFRLQRMFLHAWQLSFLHPATLLTTNLTAALPPECDNAVASLSARLPVRP